MLLAHFTPPDRLNNPLAVSEGENGENGALQARVSLVSHCIILGAPTSELILL
jgi:hypothetical protein